MGDNLRQKILQTFKKLHRTRMKTFQGDEHALQVLRNKINEEYKKYKNVTNTAAIEELNKFAEEVEHEVRTTIVQAVETKPGHFELRITPDTTLVDNVPYKDEPCNRSKDNLDISTSKDKTK
ncbi:complex III assembly factor LYRM7 isoform X2 [Apis cerana]|uniref:LYR motif-containing protein n=1 Tax=Apis cerana cerana TaxID=94128 RepID=A0A2A3E005_APICC|nr:complex III assembly factor LYRM7 isoform X2 [Apis cerana]PBC25123.1 LYR motif-containing protein [Apis cerana cerana]